MANQLFEQFGNQPNNAISSIINQVKEIEKTFQGDPKAEVEKLLNSGKMSQAQFNKFSQMANQIISFMK